MNDNEASLSRWQVRKIHMQNARAHAYEYTRYLQNLLNSHHVDYVSLKVFKVCAVSQSNLERYEIDANDIGDEYAEHRDPMTFREVIGRMGSAPLSSSTEWKTIVAEERSKNEKIPDDADKEKNCTAGRESSKCDVVTHEISTPPSSPTPRNKHDPLQCQLCKRSFDSRNQLFEHLNRECLKGQLERTGVDDAAHNQRWRSRERARNNKAVSVFRKMASAEKRRYEKFVAERELKEIAGTSRGEEVVNTSEVLAETKGRRLRGYLAGSEASRGTVSTVAGNIAGSGRSETPRGLVPIAAAGNTASGGRSESPRGSVHTAAGNTVSNGESRTSRGFVPVTVVGDTRTGEITASGEYMIGGKRVCAATWYMLTKTRY